MPNAHTEKKLFRNLPLKSTKFYYKYIASSKYDKLLYVESLNENFFIKIIDKNNHLLFKADKITRPTNVKIIQDAIQDFIQINKLSVLSSNVISKKNHLKKKSIYQKDIFFYKNYKTKNDCEIEIGFGSGRHLLHIAKKNPNKEFIGIEIHKPSIEQLLKQCKIQDITNISVLDYDARTFMQILSSNSIDKIYIHFPVPWDKKPHRRVISKSFLDESIRVLKKNGSLELRTDSENYFKYSKDLFLSLKKCNLVIRKNNNDIISSKYEDRWKKMDKNIYDLYLLNGEISKDKEELYFQEFKKKINFKKIINNFQNKVIKENGYFIHFENIYKINDNSGIIQLSFGSFGRSEHRYIVILNNIPTYLPSSIIPTKENILSDHLIKRFIYE